MHYMFMVSYSFLCNYIDPVLIYLTIAVVKCTALAENKGVMYGNDTCTTDTKVYNDTCTMSCTLGYNLTSTDDVRMCTEDGTWSNNVTCERMSKHEIMHILLLLIYQRKNSDVLAYINTLNYIFL